MTQIWIVVSKRSIVGTRFCD